MLIKFQCVNQTLTTLISKVEPVQNMEKKKFGPSTYATYHEVITKVLTHPLREVMDKLLSLANVALSLISKVGINIIIAQEVFH